MDDRAIVEEMAPGSPPRTSRISTRRGARAPLAHDAGDPPRQRRYGRDDLSLWPAI